MLFALVPTLVYYFSVHSLGSPVGNIDTGGMWGSYIGLLFLAAAFVAIGVFASSISENQIISFIVAVFFCFIFHTGFDSLSSLSIVQPIQSYVINLGINEHYISMSRGVIDTRDMIYFLSLICIFILLTKTTLESRKWQ